MTIHPITSELQEDCELGCTTGTERSVCLDIAARQRKGIVKYGVTVAGNPLALHDWLQHAYEEHLDAAIYLKRAIAELEAAQPAKNTEGEEGE